MDEKKQMMFPFKKGEEALMTLVCHHLCRWLGGDPPFGNLTVTREPGGHGEVTVYTPGVDRATWFRVNDLVQALKDGWAAGVEYRKVVENG